MAGGATGYPPVSITMDIFHRDWEPEGWRLIIIGPTSTWRQEWGVWEAIRDIVQNALDEAESYSWGYDSRGLWIADKGKGVTVSDFLLGPAKLKPSYARGKFGEGMKIAALCLLRKGYPVQVNTVDRELWMIFMEQEANGRVDTLAALWRPDGITIGTEFHIIGYTGPAFERYFAVNLPRSLILAEVPSPLTEPKVRLNQLIAAEGMAAGPSGGLIYARDIYMKSIHSIFSYNLWGFDMAPDRHAPKNEDDMWVDMGRLWSGIRRQRLLEQFLRMVIEPPEIVADESYRLSMNQWDMGEEPTTGKSYAGMLADNALSWQAAWGNVAGFDAVIRTAPRWDGMVKHLGYTLQSVSWNVKDTLATVIKTDTKLVEESQDALRQVAMVPDDELTLHAAAHLKLARAMVEYTDPGVKVYAGIIPPASDRTRTAGLYDMGTQEIIIHLQTLEKARSTIDAVVHELGHHIALLNTRDPIQAEDLQPAHSTAMTHVAAKIVQATSRGEFDDYLKGVTW
ncbi:hypothetical protein ES705_33732 [subsurface metagenome]